MKSVEIILGYIREQFYRFSRGCKPRKKKLAVATRGLAGKSPCQDTGLGKALIDTKLILNVLRVNHACLEPIGYHSESSEAPYSTNQFLGRDFVCHFLQQSGSSTKNTSKLEKSSISIIWN